MIPADLLAAIKKWLGIVPGDCSQDVWLEAQAAVVLAAMRQVAGRWLYPPAAVLDVFQVPLDPCNPCHPACGCACPPVQLAQLPVVEITALSQDDHSLLPADYAVDPMGTVRAVADRRPLTIGGSVLEVEYVAGFATLPAELQAALFELVGSAWSAAGRGDTPGLGIPAAANRVQIQDVGTIDFGDPGTLPGQVANPILGRYASLLGPYVNWPAQIGGHPCRLSRVGAVLEAVP